MNKKTKGRAAPGIGVYPPVTTIEEMCMTFAGAIAALVREQVRQELESVLAPMSATPRAPQAKRVKPRSQPVPGKPAKKRTPSQIGAQANQALSEIKRHPHGLGVEKLGELMGLTTRELALPLKSLIAGGHIITVGWKRAMKYHAASRGKK